jgi:integrase
MRGLITSYKSDPIWLEDTSASTRKLWAPWLDRISEAFGAFKVTAFRRDDMVIAITKWRDTYRATPRAADTAIQVLSRLMTYGRVSPNPGTGIKKLYKGDRAEVVWSDAELDRLAEYGSPELIQAVRLAVLTGMRQADLCTLKWSDVKALRSSSGVRRAVRARSMRRRSTAN